MLKMLVWYGVRGPAGLCVVAAGRMFGHAWMALEPHGATGAECPGAVPGGDGGYLGGYRLEAGILAGNHIQAPRKGACNPTSSPS